MLAAATVPRWLDVVATVAIAVGFACALGIAADIVIGRYRQRMGVMNVVWPVTGLYFGPVALCAYARWGRPKTPRWHRAHGDPPEQPEFATPSIGASHCGAGCAIGDVVGAWIVFTAGLTLGGIALYPEYFVDFTIAYLAGIAFQYFAIAPMRGLSFSKGLRAAVKADTLSLAAFEVGMFGWMAVVQLVLFGSRHLEPSQITYWFFMQIAMVVGFFTTLPVNAWLIRRGIKEAM
jgi:hypothetical protein